MSTTKQIKSALNELKSSVSHQVRCIKNDISSLDVYKSNYDALLEIPLVQKLLKENELLKKENDKLEKQLLSILLEKHNKKNKKQQKSLYKHLVDLDVDVESDAVKILDICDIPIKKEKPTKKENIVYELIEEKCDIVLDSNIKQNINVEKKEHIEVVVVEEEEEEVLVEEEEVVVEEEEVVIEEEEEEVVIEEEEEEVVVEEKEEEEEEVKYNAVKEVVEEDKVVEEEVVEVEEEVVEVEEEVVEVEEEVVEVEEEVEEEEEVYEVTIKGKTYYVMNEKNSIIYDIDENGDISIEVGAYKNGKPVFTKVNK